MRFEIISVGTELLLGQIVNTDARDISRMLSELGFDVYYTTVVGDNPQRLRSALEIAANRADGIITTGGLGPTEDDLTKETVAEFCGLKCVTHERSLQRLKERFSSRSTPMPKNNLKQADMPEGCIVLDNDNGTAPGAVIETDKNTFIILPGPPSELKPMLENKVRPYLEKKASCIISSRTLKVFGLGESAMEERVKQLIHSDNPTLAPYAKTGESELRITAKTKTEAEAKALIDDMEKSVRSILGDFVYAVGDNASMPETVTKLLCRNNLTLSTAESCTGGMVAERITSVPGASECFHCGYVTYSNDQKARLLGVSDTTLKSHGAVSEETALEMSRGAKERSGADIGIGITGIAGPGGGTEEKPVGLVYVSICADGLHKAYRLMLTGNRSMVRERACLYALDLVRRYVLKLPCGEYIW